MPENMCESCGAPYTAANPGSRLCLACRVCLQANLALLPGLHTACADELVHGARQVGERVTGGLPGGITLREPVMTARSDVITVLASWATMVADEQRLEGRRRRRLQGQDAASLVAFLQRHLDWLAAHPAVGDFASEVASLVSALRGVLDPDTTANLTVSSCDRPGCAEPVLVRVGVREPGRHPVSCAVGHRVPPERWLRLHRVTA
jgi:hypothetical protein